MNAILNGMDESSQCKANEISRNIRFRLKDLAFRLPIVLMAYVITLLTHDD